MSATKSRRKVAVLTAASVAVVALGAGLPSGSSGQTSSSEQTIKVYSLTLRGKEQPTHVVARGPISGIGTMTQTDRRTPSGEVHDVVLRFKDGTVRLVARARSEGWRPVNRRTCTAQRFGRGTFTISGGTGAYEGAAGDGAIEQGGVAIAQRTRTGRCRGAKTPLSDVVLYVKIRMVGAATVPSS